MAQRQFRSDDTSPKWSPQYGTGADGNKIVSSNETYNGANAGGGATAAEGQKNVSIDTASTFANGDLVLIHQSRGAGVGKWELNKIASGGGTTSLVMKYDLCNTYTESGGSQFQVLELKQFRNLTVNNGFNFLPPAWDGSKGGIIAFFCEGIANIVGNILPSYKGYIGGDGASIGSRQGRQGDGSAGAPGASNAANGTGGGGGNPDTAAGDGGGGGGGGSHATAGTQGTSKNNGGPGTPATTIVGNAELTEINFGGAGGEGGADDSGSHGRGGYGGGIAMVFARRTIINGSISSDGENGTPPTGQDGGHGGAAGGSILVKSEKVTQYGTLRAIGGVGSQESSRGGNGGEGRINIDYGIDYTVLGGSSSPAANSRVDKGLIKRQGGAALLLNLR